MQYPSIRIQSGHDKRLRGGSPWVFSNELQLNDEARAMPPGSLVRLMAPNGKIMGVAQFNPHSLIAARILTRNKDAVIDEAFIERRLARALALRDRLVDRPFYRLVHAEGDGLPGLVIDRYDDILVCQFNTAGMAALQDEVLAVLKRLLKPRAIYLKNDSPTRRHEGLELETGLAHGVIDGVVLVEENGLVFEIDLLNAQKTGWYFDQRDNHAFAARLARDTTVLDVFSYAGGFGLAALAGGATHAVLADRAEPALAAARASAARQGVMDKVTTREGEAFAVLDALGKEKQRFGLVIADPPAFVKAKKDLAVGLRTYRKLAREAASLVAEGGFFCMACCSHNVAPEMFRQEVWSGIKAAGRGGRLLHVAGAAPDHPVNPALPETAYLKFLAFALD